MEHTRRLFSIYVLDSVKKKKTGTDEQSQYLETLESLKIYYRLLANRFKSPKILKHKD